MTTPAEERVARAKEMLSDLHRLIEALDRPVPQLDRKGQARIAREAADLRERALRLIHNIEAEPEP